VCCKMCSVYQEMNSMEHSPEKLTLLLAGQEISYIVLNPTMHCHVEYSIVCTWCAIFGGRKCKIQEGLFLF
jgi:hypothetical protein